MMRDHPDRYSREFLVANGAANDSWTSLVTCFECGAVLQADAIGKHDQWHKFLDDVLGIIRP